MLAQAHVLEDGRRVFQTEDGTQVFDEFGDEVGLEEISPLDIDDSRPTWEEYSAELSRQTALEIERTEILEFQSRLDDAREIAAAGEVAPEVLETLDAELEELMPPSMLATAPGSDQYQDVEPSRSTSLAIPTTRQTLEL